VSDIINKGMVRRAQKGDSDAFMELFQEVEASLYRTIYMYLQDVEDALDAMQETACRAFKSIGQLKEPGYFKTWVTRIAIHVSVDQLRKRPFEVSLTSEQFEALPRQTEDDIPLTLTLKHLLEMLNMEEKSVIILRYYHDYTIKDTAELLKIPLGTAKTTLYRALSKLRKQAKEEQIHGQSD
jgi:RNA polymerase sigma-70 factor (ECF subfamily)